MPRGAHRQKTIAVWIDLQWPLKRHYEVLAGIRRFARGKPDWKLMVDPLDNLEKPSVLRKKYDAIIGRLSLKMGQAARRASIPAVHVVGDPRFTTIAMVITDAAARGKLAVTHLTDCGYRHLGFVTDPYYIRERRLHRALIKAARQAHASFTHFVRDFSGPLSQDNRKSMARYTRWLQQCPKPIGIFCSTDNIASHLMNHCQSLGLRVPEDVGILGLGDDEPICENLDTSLSSINAWCEKRGFRAAQVLDQIMLKELPVNHFELLPPGEVITRRSTDIQLVDDPIVAKALSVIGHQFQNELSQKDIAEQTGLSVRNLQRRFKKTLGRNLHDEVLQHRVELAQRLLCSTKLELRRIAEMSGLKTPKHMGVVFTRLLGLTPTAWRIQSQSKP